MIMGKKTEDEHQVKKTMESFSFIDSTTHRLRPSKGRLFSLGHGNKHLSVYVKLRTAQSQVDNSSTFVEKGDKYELTIPILKDKSSMMSVQVTNTKGKGKCFLAAMTSPSQLVSGTQRVSLSLYSEDE